ncbi:MAG: MFS transporter [Gemmatimonadetes bacterium]|nr:MFS transporter [Gemmatimonadota bacterium]NNK62921.1 MFS transporter [Gemmatimonadota bacterium]
MVQDVSDRRAVRAWISYDWAISAFNTLVGTFIYNTYFARTFAPTEELGMALWSRGVIATAILVALLSPILGAVADRSGRRRRYLVLMTLVCAAFTVLLTFVSPGDSHAVLKALTIYVIANVAFEMATVLYNAFLPELVTEDRIGRVSGYGWGIGYIGGLVVMAVALFLFVEEGTRLSFIPTADGFNYRATNILVAIWVIVFSLPMFLFVKEPPVESSKLDVAGAFRELRRTFAEVRRYREIVKFLVARLIYNDGLVTVFIFGAIYAQATFGFDQGEVLVFGIVLNVVAGLGALGFGFVDDRLGGKKTLMITLAGLVAATTIATLAPNRTWFWAAGVLIGIFVGPNQSASRSLMGRFVPGKHKGEFFGFFAFSGKVTSFMGPMLLGALVVPFGMRVAVSSLILFFTVGALILLTVDEQAGIEAARAADV